MINPYPKDFILKHYIVLSLDHAVQNYINKSFYSNEVNGMHGWRATAKEYDFLLPSQSQMRLFESDTTLDASKPLKDHLIVKQNQY